MKSKAEQYFRKYLQIAPLCVALWRSVEARHLSKIKLQHPILDIGCGWGEFAEAFGKNIDMGIDTAPRDLYAAAKGKMYKNLALADARDLPFSDNSYGSIISISTFEHIPNPTKLLKEMYRVLEPGGILAVTMETEEVDRNTFYRPFFRKIGLKFLSDWMTRAYNTKFHRHNLPSKKKWVKDMEDAGFKIISVRDIISPTVTKLYDIFILTSWPAQLFRPFIGRRKVFRPKILEDLLVKIFLKYIQREEEIGTNLFIVATKLARKN
ncbi:MAG: class I SAM-dependent methyltransferase [Candidatus Levybacteria bacterium]|nr:class I SAM-dependent methyltransferase [Candidatus Levybacteria bacterium]